MDIRFIYKVIPVFIFTVSADSKLLSHDAVTFGLFIFTSKPDNEALNQHELVHARQAVRNLFIVDWIKTIIDDDEWGYEKEIEAYATQIIYRKNHGQSESIDFFVKVLDEKYGFEGKKKEIKQDLKDKIKDINEG